MAAILITAPHTCKYCAAYHEALQPGQFRCKCGQTYEVANDGPPLGIEAVVDAVRQVWETGASEGLTAEGKPRVDALEAILGYDITMAERDAAWEAYKEGQ